MQQQAAYALLFPVYSLLVPELNLAFCTLAWHEFTRLDEGQVLCLFTGGVNEKPLPSHGRHKAKRSGRQGATRVGQCAGGVAIGVLAP